MPFTLMGTFAAFFLAGILCGLWLKGKLVAAALNIAYSDLLFSALKIANGRGKGIPTGSLMVGDNPALGVGALPVLPPPTMPDTGTGGKGKVNTRHARAQPRLVPCGVPAGVWRGGWGKGGTNREGGIGSFRGGVPHRGLLPFSSRIRTRNTQRVILIS